MSRIGNLFRQGWFIVLIGLLLLSLLIWFAGPYFAFADFKPFESVVVRLVFIVLLFLVWIVWLQIRQMMNLRASQKLAEGVASQATAPATGAGKGGGSDDAAQLQARFDEAIATLRKSKTGGSNLYELPWYIIIGPPGSGKTTALANSGLRFPLAQKYGNEAVRGVGGTRNCDWWFSDEAILLDTAGRFTTQDSDRMADAAGWSEFLKLLKKYRKRRPVNGVLVALSVTDLLTGGEAVLEKNVLAVRNRLEELNRHLGISLPVYVLFTKCDLLAGFDEFFDPLGEEQRAQVWGASFPIDVTYSGRAAAQFGKEFDLLVARLQSQVLKRLDEERDVRRRARIFGFPQQLALLRPMAEAFLGGAFMQTQFEGKVLLRGVYFTSGTQEGTPIDRLIGTVARSFGLDARAATRGIVQGRAYFIERLLRQVVFHEAGLAGLNRRLELRKTLLQTVSYVGLAALGVLGLAALTVSFTRNSSYLHDVQDALAIYGKASATPVAVGDMAGQLAPLDALYNVFIIADQHHDHPPLLMRFGLYQGKGVGSAARDAYYRDTNARLVPALGLRLRGMLGEVAAQPLLLYDVLRAYLMLGIPEHFDGAYIGALAQAELMRVLPNDRATRESIAAHLDRTLNEKERVRSIPLDQGEIAKARNALALASVPTLIYGRIQIKYRDDTKHELHLDQLVPNLETAFSRRSNKPWTEPVPALYTNPVFHEVSRLGAPGIISEFGPEPWVLGDKAASGVQLNTAYTAMSLYEQDYITYWDGLLNDLQVNPRTDLKQTLFVLGSPASPLKGIMQVVHQQTDLLTSNDAESKLLDDAAKAAKDKLAANPLAKALAGAASAGAPAAQDGTAVTKHFEALNQLTPASGAAGPIDGLSQNFQQAYQQIAGTGNALGQSSTLDAVKSGKGEVFQAINLQAQQLPGPVKGLVASVGSRSSQATMDQMKTELGQRLQQDVQPDCKTIIGGGYPFDRNSVKDVPLGDFGRLFAPNGILDAFFQQTMAPMVDRSTTPWKAKPGADGVTQAMIDPFQQGDDIREAWFRPGSGDPEVRFTLTPQTLDSAVGRLVVEINGSRFEYRHDEQTPWTVVWPGTGQTLAAVTFEELGGGAPYIKFDGPWALFRLLDKAHVVPKSDTEFLVTFETSGHSTQLVLRANSIRNPFRSPGALTHFRCPG